MDDTWRRVRGCAVSVGGEAIRMSITTVDGRDVVVQLVPEMVTQLVAELVNAKTKAEIVAGGDRAADQLDPARMRQPIDAERFVLTNYQDRGRTMVQVLTKAGGVFEFLVPLGSGQVREARGE
jgi:hypothetical protein